MGEGDPFHPKMYTKNKSSNTNAPHIAGFQRGSDPLARFGAAPQKNFTYTVGFGAEPQKDFAYTVILAWSLIKQKNNAQKLMITLKNSPLFPTI